MCIKNFATLLLLFSCCALLPQQLLAKKAPEPRSFRVAVDYSEAWELKDNIRYSKITGYPLSLYDLNYKTNATTPEARALQWVNANQGVLGITKEEIQDLRVHLVRKSDSGITVRLRQNYKGIPVNKSEITVNMDNDFVVRFVATDFRAGINLETTLPLITPQFAASRAVQQINARGNMSYQKTTLIVDWHNGNARLAYKVNTIADQPTGEWEVKVDALTGELFQAMDVAHYHDDSCKHGHGHGHSHHAPRYNSATGEIVFATGTGPVFDPDPLSSATVSYGTGGYTDGNDANTPDLASQVFTYTLQDITLSGGTYSLVGPWAQFFEQDAPNKGDFSQASSAFVFNREDDGFEATNIYYHIDWSMRYLNVTLGCAITPTQYSGGARFDPHGANGQDQSYYTGGVGAVVFGEGCVDDGEDSDVIHHELGHALHDWVTGGGLSQVDGLSEGCGDYWAGSYNRSIGNWTTADPQYYWIFNWDGHNECWGGRSANYRPGYPGGLVNQIHTDGQIWATCMLDVWEQLGQQETDKIFWEGLGMTNGSTNQNDAANAVYQAAINLNYTTAQLSAIHTALTDCGYTLPDLPMPLVEFMTTEESVSEGDGCTSQTVNAMVVVRLEPTANTVVTISAPPGVTVSPTMLTFTPANYNTPQAVSITVEADAVIEANEQIVLTITSAAGGGISVGTNDTFTLTVNDDDFAPSTGGTGTLLSEDFDGGLGSWTVTDGGSNAFTWAATANYNGSTLDGTPFAMVDSDAAGNGSSSQEYLYSPVINAAGATGMMLNFDQYFRVYNAGYNETATIEVYDGSTWQNIYTLTQGSGDQGGWSAPDAQSIAIPDAYANANMQIRFYYDAEWDYWWAIDNVELTGNVSIAVQSPVNTGSGDEQHLGPNDEVYFYDPATGNIMARIKNLTAHDYGCTTVEVERAGTGASNGWTTCEPDHVVDKTFQVTPTNPNPAGSFEISLYYTEAEIAGWATASGLSRANLMHTHTLNDMPTPATSDVRNYTAPTIAPYGSDWTYAATYNGTGLMDFGLALEPQGVSIAPKVFLQGPLSGALMQDDLRAASLLPMTEPYSATGYAFSGCSTAGATNAGVLAVTGAKAVIDWVIVEVRDNGTGTTVLASRAALLLADGNVVDTDGVSAVNFAGIAPGTYHIAIRHRNHLGVMTDTPVSLN